MITLQEVITAILSGKFTSENIAGIQQAIKSRAEIEKSELRRTLKVGQTIWFNDTVRPKYLSGQELEITAVNRERIAVRFKNANASGRFGTNIPGCPISLITTTKPPYAQPVVKETREPFSISRKDIGKMPPGIS